MMDFFNKAMNFGLGAISITREKAENLIDEMVEQGEISREEAKQTMEELIRKGNEQRMQIQNIIKDEFNNFKTDNAYVKKVEFDTLEVRVTELEARIKELEAKLSAE
jgi:polyhydroxyalkanoate synthesis regulator phasin